ncbi:MFS transporter [Streptomyces sp. NPDC085460]|uniref:MFS transporter n=1 Tax=Streptomyces sp. NPDC085460 TaxID=3365723 RepID=UPI0037D2E89C
MIGNAVTAVGAGVITAAASSTAAAVVAPERRGRALAFGLGGLTLATALGMPLGTLIGGAGWQLTLSAVAGVGVLAALGVAAGLPRAELPAASLADRLRPLGQARVPALLAVTSLVVLGAYTLYTYVVPALRGATGGSEPLSSLVLPAMGAGTPAGTLAAGRLVDRRDPAGVLTGALLVAVPALALTPVAVRGLASALVWAVVWGVTVGMVVVPQQHRLLALGPTSAPVLLGLTSSALYPDVALGGRLGGLAQESFGLAPAALGPLGAAVTALAPLWHLTTARDKSGDGGERPRDTPLPWMRSKSSSPTPSARPCGSGTCS